MDNPLDTLRYMLLAVLGLPLAAGLVVAILGGFVPAVVRRVALALALVHLGLTGSLVFLAADQLTDQARWTSGAATANLPYFEPIAVPGDPGHGGDNGGQIHETTWAALSLTPAVPGIAGRRHPVLRRTGRSERLARRPDEPDDRCGHFGLVGVRPRPAGGVLRLAVRPPDRDHRRVRVVRRGAVLRLLRTHVDPGVLSNRPLGGRRRPPGRGPKILPVHPVR